MKFNLGNPILRSSGRIAYLGERESEVWGENTGLGVFPTPVKQLFGFGVNIHPGVHGIRTGGLLVQTPDTHAVTVSILIYLYVAKLNHPRQKGTF